jgi:uncharacterized membrane protein YcaP (DUF421 family)
MDWVSAFHDLIGHSRTTITAGQMCLRGIIVILFGLVLIRLFGRRAFGRQSPLDIVVTIVIGSNLSRAMTANARFLPTLAATAAIVVFYWLLEHLAVRSHAVSWLTKGMPIKLMRGGRLDSKTLKRAAVSEGDIEEAARSSGLPELGAVEDAVLERNGKISTLKRR